MPPGFNAQATSIVEQQTSGSPDRTAKTTTWGEIPRLTGKEARDFLGQRQLPLTPVVLTDVMDGSSALRKWSPYFFRATHPWAASSVGGRKITLAEQLDRIENSTEEDPAPYPYRFNILEDMPELLQDLEPHLSFGRTDRTFHPLVPRSFLSGTVTHELFIGGRGAAYPELHYDVLGLHTQITQIHGEKEFVLYDPSQTPLLYPRDHCSRVSRIPNVFAPDLVQFPRFSEACPQRVLLGEGETLYFPTGWWHTTRMHGPSITYGRIVLTASNWNGMLSENLSKWRKEHPVAALPAYAFGKVLGGALSVLESMK